MTRRLLAATAAALLLLPATAQAQERHAIKDGFTFPPGRTVKIAVYRPDVRVGTLTTGGADEANAEWTEAARGLILEKLKAKHHVRGAEVVFPGEPEGDDGASLAEYRALFTAVSNSIITHKLFPGNRLPTKKQTFDWTLGEGVSRLGELSGADYALFVFTHDAYGSSGRKAMQALGMLGCVFGACVLVQAGVHIGYAGLVDLRTGDVIWFNADPAVGGDVRTAEGAEKRVDQLLDGMPGRPVPAKPGTRK